LLAVGQRQYRLVVTGEKPTNHRRIRQHLDGSGVLIESVERADALRRIRDQETDLVVIDLANDGVSGVELCRVLKDSPETVLLPVVVLSDSEAKRLEGLAVGADAVMAPKVSQREFLIRINALLRIGTTRRTAATARLEAEVSQREQIRDAFRRYVAPSLVDQILEDTSLRHRALVERNTRLRATVLFADMRGFTRLSEQLSASEVVPLLNEYFSLLTQIAFDHQGTVFNMAGDCLMVGFGVPVPQPDASVRAVNTAREMLSSFRALAESWKQRVGIEIGLGIGINEGEVIAGNIGSQQYLSYTIIGDAVNVACRLGQRARAGELLFSETVRNALTEAGADVGAVQLPPLILRGRQQPVSLYCVPIDERIDLRPSSLS
jgi:adenylate cyclase